jgi:hypothetical protein
MNMTFFIYIDCFALRFWASPYAADQRHIGDLRFERMLQKVKAFDPGFPRDEPSEIPTIPSRPFPTDVPAPGPHDIPAPAPIDVPPPDPGELPPPAKAPDRPKGDPKPRPIP